MQKKYIITEKDYQLARFVLNNIYSIMSPTSPAALKIAQTAEKIIVLYHLQPKYNLRRAAINQVHNRTCNRVK